MVYLNGDIGNMEMESGYENEGYGYHENRDMGYTVWLLEWGMRGI